MELYIEGHMSSTTVLNMTLLLFKFRETSYLFFLLLKDSLPLNPPPPHVLLSSWLLCSECAGRLLWFLDQALPAPILESNRCCSVCLGYPSRLRHPSPPLGVWLPRLRPSGELPSAEHAFPVDSLHPVIGQGRGIKAAIVSFLVISDGPSLQNSQHDC